MDPNEALRQLIDAAVKGYGEAVIVYAETLAEWFDKGGFAPDDPR